MKSGRDQMVIDPEIYTKRKKRIGNVMMSSTPSSSPSVKYPNDGLGNSLERMPSFARAEMNQHITNSGKKAFVLSPLRESSRHRNQNRNSSFFSEEGFRPASEAPGISSSVRITESSTAPLEDAILRGFSSDKTGISYDKSPDSRY